MKTTRHLTKSTLVLLILSPFAMAGSKDVKIDIETGDINTFAIGDNTKASVSVGTLPPARQGCQNIRIQHGNITRIAIGNNANASIHLPTQQIDCKEK